MIRINNWESTGEWSNCTWSVWQLVYNNLGIALPGGWGNAGSSWITNAQNAGYSTGSNPQKNSIMVFDGHVAFVTDISADGSQVYIKEGGYGYAPNQTYHEGWCNAYGSRNGGQAILGYIYLASENYFKVTTCKSQNGQLVVKWSKHQNATMYNVRIKDLSTNSDYTAWNVSSLEINKVVPTGNYQVYVDAIDGVGNVTKSNECTVFNTYQSNITCEVHQGEVEITWSKDIFATVYNVRIKNTDTGKDFTLWSIDGCSATVELSAGVYEVYVDACNTDNNYIQASNKEQIVILSYNATPKPDVTFKPAISPSIKPTASPTFTPTTEPKPNSGITPRPVTPKKKSVRFIKKKVTIKKGKTKTLNVKVVGAGKVKFTINKKGRKVVSLSKKKAKSVVVMGKKKGTAIVQAKTAGKVAKCEVTVK